MLRDICTEMSARRHRRGRGTCSKFGQELFSVAPIVQHCPPMTGDISEICMAAASSPFVVSLSPFVVQKAPGERLIGVPFNKLRTNGDEAKAKNPGQSHLNGVLYGV